MDWNVSVNLFETTTRRRFPAMNALLEDHWSKCKEAVHREPGDADFTVMQKRIEGARAAWREAYHSWRASRENYKGCTHRMKALIADLRGRHIQLWDVMVSATNALHGEWRPGSPGHRALFPNGRKPFQQGGVDARIAEVAALAGNLAAVPVLGPVAALAAAFHSVLRTARNEQREAEAETAMRSAGAEEARRAAAIVLQKNLARLMEKYAETPSLILTFFDLRDVKARRRRKGEGSSE